MTTLFLSLLLCGCGNTEQTETFCNPLDLDYGWGIFKQELPLCRTSADPVMVLFKGKYYLFSTHDIGGYRVSDDMMNWENRHFNEEVSEAALNYGSYVAPAVAADDRYMYFIKLNRDRRQKTVKIIRSEDPENGKWEICGEIRRVSDPTMFIDNGRYFIFHGLGANQSIKCFELDPETLTEIPGSERLLLDYITDVNDCNGGYQFGRREIYDEIEAPDWKGRFRMMPCPEGSWIVRNNGRYYLQYATPGTICTWYCDVVMTSDSIDGKFTEEPYNPVSLKTGGFIGGAGHSSVFEDKWGNWWQITTMWVGNKNEFERRLGLFPVTFDEKGRMQVHTMLGDYPMIMPQRKFDAREGHLKGWWCLSHGKTCHASSYVEGHDPSLAADENVRTWWAAEGGKDEWFTMDLGGIKTVNALQLNFAELNHTPDTFDEDYTAYIVSYSPDGRKWKSLVDKSRNTRTNPHEYIVLKKPVKAAFLKVECVHAMNDMPFGIRDLRVFGSGDGEKPQPVKDVKFTRDRQDGRYGDLVWTPSPDADGYIVKFGISADFLNHNIQIKDGRKGSLALHMLTKGQKYCFSVCPYNENGITEGMTITE